MMQTPIYNGALFQAPGNCFPSNRSQLSPSDLYIRCTGPMASPPGSPGLAGHSPMLRFQDQEELRRRRVQNTIDFVPVATCEHVAEIVGKQGAKIKALRAKTNTYIKTPARGQEPVFLVSGLKDDVVVARQEILAAAAHFTQLRATQSNSINSTLAMDQEIENKQRHVTVQVRVPQSIVQLLVGPNGANIMRIQELTHTFIATPSKEQESMFEVTGLPGNVEVAKQEIESLINARTAEVALSSISCYEENQFNRTGNTTSLSFKDLENSFQKELDIQIPGPVLQNSNQNLLIPSIYLESLQENEPKERFSTVSQPLWSNSSNSVSPSFYCGPESSQNIWSTLATELEQFQLQNKNKSLSNSNLDRVISRIWG